MTIEIVEKVAAALLYEGYILYPYRPSSVKNQQRWNFGVLYPEKYSQAQRGSDSSKMETECLVKGDPQTLAEIRVRFLHLRTRDIVELSEPVSDLSELRSTDFNFVSTMKVDDEIFQSWQEAVERTVSLSKINLDETLHKPTQNYFSFPFNREIEPLRDSTRQVVGAIERRQEMVNGVIEVTTEKAGDGLFKLGVTVSNLTDLASLPDRDEVLLNSMVCAHTILTVESGEFISLLETPDEFQDAAKRCRNIGTWPVLVGEDSARDCMLSSPIILYDYPQIAPESAGDLFDATEIDEILTLRIMTLTEDEKREMRNGDQRARRILERTETLPEDYLMKLHGTIRGLRPVGKAGEEI